MPDLVGHDLIIWILHYIADPGGLFAGRYFFERSSVEAHRAAAPAMRRQHGFQVTQQRGFAAAGFAAENDIGTPFDGEIYVFERRSGCGRVAKGQIFDLEMCH